MSMEIFLMSMQAAGAISDFAGTQSQIKMGRAGAELELEQINTRLEEERLAYTMRSLDAMKQLRYTLASQRVIFGARGQQANAGSAFIAQNKAIGEANTDERVRRMNLLSKEATLRAAGALSGMHQLASETRLGQELTRRLYEQTPIAETAKRFGFGVEGVWYGR